MIEITIKTDTIEEFDSFMDGYSTSRTRTIDENKKYILEKEIEEFKKEGNK